MCEHLKVLGLLDLNHLDKSLAHLPTFLRNVFILVQSGYATTLFLEHHIQFADPIDGVSFLPDGFQVGFFLEA